MHDIQGISLMRWKPVLPVHNLLDNAGARVFPQAQGNTKQQHMELHHIPADLCSLAVVVICRSTCRRGLHEQEYNLPAIMSHIDSLRA